MSASIHRSFLSRIPTEIVSLILEILDISSLLRCREVSHYFLKLVDSSALLKYKVELYAANLVEGSPGSSATASARLKSIIEHQKAWRLLRWNEKVFYKLSQDEYSALNLNAWEFRGGVLAFGAHHQLHFIQLPSPLRGIEERRWGIPDLRFSIKDFCIDPAQDLLVVIEQVANPEMSFRIHLLSLSTGERHPLAEIPKIEHSPKQLGSWWWYVVRICYDHVAVMFQLIDEGSSELVVWNWKTGEGKKIISGDIGTYIFISETLILLGMDVEQPDRRCQWSLDVLDIHSPTIGEQDLDSVRLCSFQLPEVKGGQDDNIELTLYTDYDSLSPPRKDITYPFRTDDSDAVIAVAPFGSGGLPTSAASITFFFLRSQLLAAIQDVIDGKRPKINPWDQWQDIGVRVLRLHTPIEWFCYLHGTRAIIPTKNIQEVCVYDFCQRTIKRKKILESGTQKIVGDVEFVMEPSEDDFDYFAEPVKSNLAYMKTTLILPELTDRTELMLGEDVVVMVPNSSEFIAYCI